MRPRNARGFPDCVWVEEIELIDGANKILVVDVDAGIQRAAGTGCQAVG